MTYNQSVVQWLYENRSTTNLAGLTIEQKES